eukprot:7960777-Pyramimonas_sp.AAC.1
MAQHSAYRKESGATRDVTTPPPLQPKPKRALGAYELFRKEKINGDKLMRKAQITDPLCHQDSRSKTQFVLSCFLFISLSSTSYSHLESKNLEPRPPPPPPHPPPTSANSTSSFCPASTSTFYLLLSAS